MVRKTILFILAICLALVPAMAMAAHSGDGATTITAGYSNKAGSTDRYIEWIWTGDGTTLSTTIDMSMVMSTGVTWYFFMISEVHGSGDDDPSDHAVTVTNADGTAILVTDNFTESGFQNAAQDMPNYWIWDGGDITVSTTDIGTDDTATVRLIFVR
jgi:hypothetical protein